MNFLAFANGPARAQPCTAGRLSGSSPVVHLGGQKRPAVLPAPLPPPAAPGYLPHCLPSASRESPGGGECMAAQAFAEFLSRVRAGDESAAAELVQQYEPLLRREVRMRLTDPSLFRLVS